jgi:thiamine-monophosphate kinase
VISVTSIGYAEKKELLCYRNGAQEGDLLCVSGDLGGAYVGITNFRKRKADIFRKP